MAENEQGFAEMPDEVTALDREALREATPCGDGQMVWRIWGAGPALVLLHGGSGSWHHWVRNIAELARSYRVIVPDLPGLGESASPPEPHTPDGLAAIVAGGLDTILDAGETYDLVGFSFGGLIGAHVAALRPERVRSLTLIGTGGLGPPGNPIEFVRLRGKSPAEQLEAHRTNLGRMMIGDPAHIDDLALAIHTRNTRLSRVNSPALYRLGRIADIVKELHVPVNGIWGANDATAVPHVAEREKLLRSLSPDVEFAEVKGAGHWVPFEAAEPFNRTLLKMLARSRPAD